MSALHQPLPDLLMWPWHTDTHSVPSPRAFLATRITPVSHLEQFIWGLLPPSQEGGACVPTPAPPLLLGSPSLEGAPRPPSAAEGAGTSLSSVLLSPLCNGTAGFLGGACWGLCVEGPPGAPRPRHTTCPLGRRGAHRVGTRRTGSHAPRSHASRKSGKEKPRLLEAPSGGLAGPGSLWGHVWCPPGSQQGCWVGRRDRVVWAPAFPGVWSSSNKIWGYRGGGTEDCGSHREVRASASRVVRVHWSFWAGEQEFPRPGLVGLSAGQGPPAAVGPRPVAPGKVGRQPGMQCWWGERGPADGSWCRAPRSPQRPWRAPRRSPPARRAPGVPAGLARIPPRPHPRGFL